MHGTCDRDPHQLVKRFEGHRGYLFAPSVPECLAVDHVELTIGRGEIYGLIGANGAGKTTLIKILSTLLLPTSGEVRILGHDLRREEEKVRASLALVTNSERSFYYRLTGWQNLRYFAGLYGLDRAEVERRARPLVRKLNLDRAMDRDYRTYSTGMQRKLAFVRAFLLETPLLLLDEPTSSLDPLSSEEIRNLVAEECRRRGQTVVLSANNLLDVERLADRVGKMAAGRLTPVNSVGAGSEPLRIARFLLRDTPEEVLHAVQTREPLRTQVGESFQVTERGQRTILRVLLEGTVTVPQLLESLLAIGLRVEEVDLKPVDLEEEFLGGIDSSATPPEGVSS